MGNWFTIDKIDTGIGISNIYEEVSKLTNKPITAVATHIHWDHIGGHKYFPEFYAHADELEWLNGKFPLSIETIKEMVIDRCDLPEGFHINDYELFQGMPTKVLTNHDIIDVGGREIEVLHTPGHSPGHICFLVKCILYNFQHFFIKSLCQCSMTFGCQMQTVFKGRRCVVSGVHKRNLQLVRYIFQGGAKLM